MLRTGAARKLNLVEKQTKWHWDKGIDFLRRKIVMIKKKTSTGKTYRFTCELHSVFR